MTLFSRPSCRRRGGGAIKHSRESNNINATIYACNGMLSLFAYVRDVSTTDDTFVIDVPGRFAPNIPNPVRGVEGLLFRTNIARPEYPSDNALVQVEMKEGDGSGTWSLYIRVSFNGGVSDGVTGHISLMNFVPCGGEWEEVTA